MSCEGLFLQVNKYMLTSSCAAVAPLRLTVQIFTMLQSGCMQGDRNKLCLGVKHTLNKCVLLQMNRRVHGTWSKATAAGSLVYNDFLTSLLYDIWYVKICFWLTAVARGLFGALKWWGYECMYGAGYVDHLNTNSNSYSRTVVALTAAAAKHRSWLSASQILRAFS